MSFCRHFVPSDLVADNRMIAALYSIMALVNFAVASKDFRKGRKVSGCIWTAASFAWCVALFLIVSGLGVIA